MLDKWRFTTFKNLTWTQGKEHYMTFDQLVKGFTTPHLNKSIQEKKDLPLWSPTTYDYEKRSGKNANHIWFLVFDIDDGQTPFDTWRLFHEYHVIAHTSYSHKPHWHKYRIILPLSEPVLASHWDRASVAAREMWDTIVGKGEPDSSALNDRARAYFRYGLPAPASEEMTAHHPMHPMKYAQTAWNVGKPLTLQYQHIVLKTQVEKKPYVPKVYNNGKASITEVMMNPAFRLAIAQQVGATIQDSEARYIRCPQCGRNSVHFSLDPSIPTSFKWATCNHVNSCGWWGKFEALL